MIEPLAEQWRMGSPSLAGFLLFCSHFTFSHSFYLNCLLFLSSGLAFSHIFYCIPIVKCHCDSACIQKHHSAPHTFLVDSTLSDCYRCGTTVPSMPWVLTPGWPSLSTFADIHKQSNNKRPILTFWQSKAFAYPSGDCSWVWDLHKTKFVRTCHHRKILFGR